MEKQNQVILREVQELQKYKNQVIRLNKSDLARTYVNAGSGMRAFMISAYSLMCFLFGLWFYHTNNARSAEKLGNIEKQLDVMARQQTRAGDAFLDNQALVASMLDKIENEISSSKQSSKEISRQLDQLYVIRDKIEQQRSIASVKPDFSINAHKQDKESLYARHSALKNQLMARHQKEREDFKKQNDIMSSRGLRAWKDFTFEQLQEKRALEMVIRNEKRLFK